MTGTFNHWSKTSASPVNEKNGIYFYNDQRSSIPWGETRTDFGRGEVCQYLRDHARMWFYDYRPDELCWDAITYIKNIGSNEAIPANDIPEGRRLMQWIYEEI